MNKNKKMKIDIKSKEKISFGEFKAWINGMLYGKGRFLPNSADWKEIKQMMEKVVPDVVEMQNPETPFFPTLPYTPTMPYESPKTPEVEPWQPPFPVTCGVNENDGCDIGFGNPLIGSNSNYGGFSLGISAGYAKHIKEGDIITTNRGPLSIGFETNTTGISNIAIDNPLPCPSVFITEQEETPEESLTALEKAQVLLKKFKDAE